MKNLMSDQAKSYLRGWTTDFVSNKFIPNHKGYDDHNLWFVNCCTGSGKAACGFESLMEDIANYESDGKKSLNAIVVPTIPLACQVVDELNEYACANYPYLRSRMEIMVKHSGSRGIWKDDDGVEHPADIKVDIDNDKNSFYIINEDSPQVVVVFVSDSFFGSANSAADFKTNLSWFKKSVTTAKEMGTDAVCGCIIFDEAHNYKTNFENIVGYDVEDTDEYSVNKDKVDDSVRMTFMDTILMTGTPCQKQCYLSRSKYFKKFTVEVNYAEALGITGIKHEPWIICPWLWVIRTFSDDLNELENAIITSFEHEIILNKVNNKANSFIHELVNCKDINSAHDMGTHIYNAMRNYLHREVDVIILHTEKKIGDAKSNENNNIIGAEWNGKKIDRDTALKLVRNIDKTYVNRDVIVFQVGMISEGINVNSFNTIVLTSSSDVKVIQQTGRGVRFLKEKYGIKKHTSIYAIAPNKSIVEAVICKQLIEQGLDLSEVLMGVAEPERPDGGGKKPEGCEFQSNGWTWNDFSPADIKEIEMKIQNMDWDATVKSCTSNPTNDILDFVEFAKAFMVLKKSGKASGGSGRGNGGSNDKANKSTKKQKVTKNAWTPLKFKNQFLRDLRKKMENSPTVKSMGEIALNGNDKVLPWLVANFFMCELPTIPQGTLTKFLQNLVCKAITEND